MIRVHHQNENTIQKCVEEDFCAENPRVWQKMVEEWFRHE